MFSQDEIDQPQHQSPRPLSPAITRSGPAGSESTLISKRSSSTAHERDLTNENEGEDEIHWRDTAFQECAAASNAGVNKIASEGLWPALEMPPISSIVPSYLTQPPQQLAHEDVQYLYQKGALTVPKQELRHGLIESYALYVHPTCPVLDLEVFDNALRDVPGQSPISLLVFQAAMYAGSD